MTTQTHATGQRRHAHGWVFSAVVAFVTTVLLAAGGVAAGHAMGHTHHHGGGPLSRLSPKTVVVTVHGASSRRSV